MNDDKKSITEKFWDIKESKERSYLHNKRYNIEYDWASLDHSEPKEVRENKTFDEIFKEHGPGFYKCLYTGYTYFIMKIKDAKGAYQYAGDNIDVLGGKCIFSGENRSFVKKIDDED